jgi:hypothetical protein
MLGGPERLALLAWRQKSGKVAVAKVTHGGLFYPCVIINWFEPATSVALNVADALVFDPYPEAIH